MQGYPTDSMVFRKLKQPAYLAPGPYIPPEPTYPTKLLVYMEEESAEGTYKYWLHESGKSIRIHYPPEHEQIRQYRLEQERARSLPLPDQKQKQNRQRRRKTRPPPTPTSTPTPTPYKQKQKQKQTWKTRWRRKPKPKKRPSAFKAWIIARAEAERKRKREARKKKRKKIRKAIARYLPRVLTVNYIKELTSYIESRRSQPPPTPPPISPCKSYCYPPLHPLPSPLSARLKFWKKRKTVVEEEESIPPPGVMMAAELFESGRVPSPKGVQFERSMWKDAHAGRLAGKRPDGALCSRSWESLVASLESKSKDGGSFGGDVDQNSSTGNQSSSVTGTSCKSTASTLFLFSLSSPNSYKPRHSRTDSSISSLHPIKESTETQPTEPKPYQYLLPTPTPSPPPDPILHQMAIDFQKIRKRKAENPPPEYIACPIFNYQGTPLAKNPLISLYFSISFDVPYAIVEYLKFTYSWIPFFELLVDRILENGGETFLFLMSFVTFGCAALPLFVLFCFVIFPCCVLHNWFVGKFRRMPFYRFKYSLGFPGHLEERESESGGVQEDESGSESESEGE